ncbi:hypothetical protein D3C81_1835000 [compost metagenome]
MVDRQPVDRIQRIIEKMRIDLGLECFELGFFFAQLGDIKLVDQRLDLLQQLVVAVE